MSYDDTLSLIKNYILSTLVLCLAHHLMCWPETSENSFKHEEKSSLDFFKYDKKSSLNLFQHKMCVAHLMAMLIF